MLILKELHDKLDAAVAEAYGWPAGLSDNDILIRLVALNQQRAREEQTAPSAGCGRTTKFRVSARRNRKQNSIWLGRQAARSPLPPRDRNPTSRQTRWRRRLPSWPCWRRRLRRSAQTYLPHGSARAPRRRQDRFRARRVAANGLRPVRLMAAAASACVARHNAHSALLPADVRVGDGNEVSHGVTRSVHGVSRRRTLSALRAKVLLLRGTPCALRVTPCDTWLTLPRTVGSHAVEAPSAAAHNPAAANARTPE